MIARLSGILAETTADSAVIDVAGVGYLVHLSGKTLSAIGPIGGEVVIPTELQVREDAWTLFGFGSPAERDAFRALTSIQGVGGRLALAILSVLSPDELARAVAQDDKAMIGRANGVGPKLAGPNCQRTSGQARRGGHKRRAPAPRGGAARTPSQHSPISASSPPKRAPQSTRRRMSSVPTHRSMRWFDWRCARRRSD